MRFGRVWVTAALAGSGALTVAAAAQRWWSACGMGGFDTDPCLERQDHRYDFVVPADPWTPVGAAAQLSRVAMVLLAVAVALLPAVLGGPRRHLPVVIASAGMVAAGVAVIGVLGLRSGLVGSTVAVPGAWVAGVLWVLGVPALALWLLATTPDVRLPGQVGRAVVAVCLVAANPFVEMLLAPMLVGYTSYDTTPWAEAVTGVALLVAAAGVPFAGAAARRAAADPGPEGPRVGSAPSVSGS